MDKFIHVYKGSPPDHCVCDQALRQLPNGDWVIIFMTGGDHEPRIENYIAVCRSKDRGATLEQAGKSAPFRRPRLPSVRGHCPTRAKSES